MLTIVLFAFALLLPATISYYLLLLLLWLWSYSFRCVFRVLSKQIQLISSIFVANALLPNIYYISIQWPLFLFVVYIVFLSKLEVFDCIWSIRFSILCRKDAFRILRNDFFSLHSWSITIWLLSWQYWEASRWICSTYKLNLHSNFFFSWIWMEIRVKNQYYTKITATYHAEMITNAFPVDFIFMHATNHIIQIYICM